MASSKDADEAGTVSQNEYTFRHRRHSWPPASDPSCSSSSDDDEEDSEKSANQPPLIFRETNRPNSGKQPPVPVLNRPPRPPELWRPPMSRARSSMLKMSFRRMMRDRIAEEPDELNSTQSADSGLVHSGMDFSSVADEGNGNGTRKEILGNGALIAVNMVPLQMRNPSLKSTSTARSLRSCKAPSELAAAAAANTAAAANLLLRKHQIASIFQHYYPEGHWGYVVLLCAFLVQVFSHGLQLSFGVLATAIARRWRMGEQEAMIHTGWLGAFSISVSLLISPMTVAVCRRKSTRLTAVMGGLVTALGCLFTSFASQFHQLFFSYGFMIGVGVGITRDPATLMLGQYFKGKRAHVEIILVAGSGIGISFGSSLLQLGISAIGWRLGLQAVTGIVFTTFVLGTFYRSASLYHPQRRAILHLKSQKRKIKNKDKEKNKIQDDRPPYFDFNTLRSKTVRILLFSICLSSLGLNAPLIYVHQMASAEGHSANDILLLQVYLGLAWASGCLLFGGIILCQSRECSISRQYLCQASLFITGICVLAFTAVEGYSGYVIFVWIYGIFYGGYSYCLKMYIYEKVRARNFARAWGFAQFSMAISNFFGVPLAGCLTFAFGPERRAGFYLSAAAIILGSLSLSLIDLHKRSLKGKSGKQRPQLQSAKSNGFTSSSNPPSNCMGDPASSSSSSWPGPELAGQLCRSAPASLGHGDDYRRMSFSEQDDVLPPVSLLSHQRSFIYDDIIDLISGGKQEISLFSEEEGIADMDIPDHLFIDELEFLDNISSCDKVENCVMLSEYEQNLIKETAQSPMQARRRLWPFGRQISNNLHNNAAGAEVPMMKIGVGGFRQSSFYGNLPLPAKSSSRKKSHNNNEIPTFSNTARRAQSRSTMRHNHKRSITVIEEASV